MKKQFTISIYIAVLFLFIAMNSNAQLVTISNTHQMPTIGDTVHYINANTFGFDATGVGTVTSKVWDESALMNAGTTYDFVFVNPATVPASLGKDSFPTASIARSESGATGYFYYQNTANDIKRLGWFASYTNYGIYKNGTFATEFHFPITAGETFTSSYSGDYAPFNVGEDSMRITSGSVSINADMQGQLILPTGAFNKALRVHVVESFHIVSYIVGVPATDNVISDDYYYWFVDTIFQPIMVYGVTSSDGTPQTPVLRYQPIVSSSTAISNIEKESFEVYPNPSDGKFFIRNIQSQNTIDLLEVYNVIGKKVYSQFQLKPFDEIDLSFAPKGIYFIKTISNEEAQTIKLVIK